MERDEKFFSVKHILEDWLGTHFEDGENDAVIYQILEVFEQGGSKMKNLDEILEETEFTQEEYQTFRKVLKHYQAEDLQYRLDEKLEYEDLTQEQYDKAVENAENIIERYDETNNADWESIMDNAIDWVIGDL